MLVFFDPDNGSSMFIRNVGSAYKSTWRINPKTIIIIVVVISFTNFSQPLSLSIEGYDTLGQGWANYGPRAKYGPLRGSMRPAEGLANAKKK
jgi:hypothetical protein